MLQAMNDHFDHYARPPSRDSSVDRYTRAASRLSGSSRQPSVDRTKPPSDPPPIESNRSGSIFRSNTPTGNGSVTGVGINIPLNRVSSTVSTSQPPFEDFILRKRSLGQDIVPSPVGQPKRTESLYIAPSSKKDSKVSEACVFAIKFKVIKGTQRHREEFEEPECDFRGFS